MLWFVCVLEVEGRRTSPPMSDDKQEGVIGHHLRVQHQGPGQSDQSYKQREEERMIKHNIFVFGCGRQLKGEVRCEDESHLSQQLLLLLLRSPPGKPSARPSQ